MLHVLQLEGNWTYSGDPSYSPLDEVRFLVGDTNSSDQLVSDAEIRYALTKKNPIGAAALIARALASKFGRLVDQTIGDLNLSYSQRKDAFLDLASQLESGLLSLSGAVPYLAGQSISDRETIETDADRVDPWFVRDQFDSVPPNSFSRVWSVEAGFV